MEEIEGGKRRVGEIEETREKRQESYMEEGRN